MTSNPPPWPGADPLHTLWVVVFGPTGDNGIRGTQLDHQRRLEALESHAQQIDTIWRVISWIGLGVSGLLGLVLSGPVGEALARWIVGK